MQTCKILAINKATQPESGHKKISIIIKKRGGLAEDKLDTEGCYVIDLGRP